MKEEFELVENSTPEQLKKIIHNIKIKNKGKAVYFKNFIKKKVKIQIILQTLKLCKKL